MAKDKRKKKQYTSIGGQALIEGIMMRGPGHSSISVRHTNGEIITEYLEAASLRDRHPILKIPLLRGVAAFIESLMVGFKALTKSMELSGLADLEEDDDEEPSKFETWITNTFGDKLFSVLTVIATVLAVILGVGLFFFVPSLLFNGLQSLVGADISGWRALFEGVLKIVIFLTYVILISQMKEIRRVFEYHGAEHKTIFCFEANEELTVENVRKQRRFHPRCGTSFLLTMLLVGILVSYILAATTTLDDNIWLWTPMKILLVPVIMALGFECIKLAGKYDNLFTRIIAAPGLWMQRITTKEPHDDQIEVAIMALKAVLPGGEAYLTKKPEEDAASKEDASALKEEPVPEAPVSSQEEAVQ